MFSSQPGGPHEVGSSPGDWLNVWRFGAIFGLLLLACFPQVILGWEALAYGDAGQFAYPVAFYHREAFWRGELPLWNPLSSCGTPFLAQWNTLTLYPLSLWYLLLPVPWSFGVFCLAHLLLAALGAYRLSYHWTANRLAAAVAGTVFGFNGLMWYGLMWPHLLAALAWMPWVVLFMKRAWVEGGRLVPVAGALGGMQLLTGGAEAILQTWLILGVLWVAQALRKETPVGKLLGRTLASGALAVGLAAAQLLPFLALLQESQRGTGYASGGMGGVAAMPLSGWANFLVPLFQCAPNYNGVFVQIGQSWTGSYYLGVIPVVLAVLAAWRARSREVWLLAGPSVFGVVLALGSPGHLYDWAKSVLPLLGFIRFPVKFVMLVVFALPLLAAFGLKWLIELPEDAWKRERRNAFLAAGGLSLLVIAILWWSWSQPLPGTAPATVAGNALVRLVFLGLALACVFQLRRRPDVRSQRFLQTAMILLLWADVLTHSSNLSPTVPAQSWEPRAVREHFQWDASLAPGSMRAMVSREALWKLLASGSVNLEQDLGARRLSQFMDLNLLDGVPKLDGFYSMDLKRFLDVFQRLYFTTAADSPGLLDFLCISRVGNPSNIVEWLARPKALPMITGGQEPVFADDATALARISEPGFDPRRAVYLPLSLQTNVTARLGECRIAPQAFSPQKVEFEVAGDTNLLVVVAQAHYPAWKAFVDGRPTKLWRANYAFQALQVPPGKHDVKLVYEDSPLVYGTWISALSLISCAAWWRLSRRTGRGVAG